MVKETSKARWAGPFSRLEIESILHSPFQTSPLKFLVKPNGDLRPLQNFSFPYDDSYPSINSYIDSNHFLTEWDGVRIVQQQIRDLKSRYSYLDAATADAKEAFRACLARFDQLPGTVIKFGPDQFIWTYSWASALHLRPEFGERLRTH
ncbi:hypothetical protein A4X06_0g5924 [Tilletia controversa]|uniref:Uncharacterized protein n=2 Tax=Tilletia TaxID=13289 RepID=A0A8X7MPR9_9BASI|nr:hypothetical protein CF336_g7072 [Tilletia laevis]KAE8187776.1 hypothetical protein CF328_g6808 [Tilletia controversa]KAE8191672.1 hypothetical protein CF335_g6026 [Tilletia laevis]KAE8244877.1 hypothetical protein A4X06_0g5924 [Tilletia controversa]KAE8245037.1 hypothetical protein A4X03_0g7514 [Tilletia caries]